MLLGEHEHSLDDKNRLTLPAKLREQLGDRVVVTRGIDGCLYVYARGRLGAARRRGSAASTRSARESRTMQRHFFATRTRRRARQAGPDGDPRARCSQTAGIGREVTVAGVYDHLEIWDRAAWREQLQEVEGSAEDVAERLANRD